LLSALFFFCREMEYWRPSSYAVERNQREKRAGSAWSAARGVCGVLAEVGDMDVYHTAGVAS